MGSIKYNKKHPLTRDEFQKLEPLLRIGYFESLIKGLLNSNQYKQSLFSKIGVDIFSNRFLILIIKVIAIESMKKWDKNNPLFETFKNIKKFLSKNLQDTYYLNAINCDEFVLLLAVSEKYDHKCENNIERVMRQLKNDLYMQYNLKVSFGGGSIYEDQMNVFHSFEEARKAIEYKGARKNNTIIWYRTIPQVNGTYSYTIEFEYSLINFVKAGDKVQLKKLLQSLYYENIEQKNLSNNMIRLLIYEMIGTIIKLLNIIPPECNNKVIEIQKSILSLDNYSYIEDFFENIEIIYFSICDMLDEQKHSHNKILINKITEYIKSSFMNPDLCLSGIASQFGFSKEYISMFFKEQTGDNFSKYLIRVRLEHAKELILRTKLSIQDIGNRVGCYSPITFRRMFKKVFGINPNAYRMDYKISACFSNDVWYKKYPISKELIFAHTDPPGGPREKSAQFFAEKIREYTGGRYLVKTYPNSFLGYDTKLLELVSSGGVDFVVAGSSIYGKYLKEISLLMTPFLIHTLEEGWHLYDDSFWINIWFKELESKGFRMLTSWERGFRSLTTTVPISNLSDIKGLRIRVPPNPIHIELWRTLGAKPIIMDIKDVYMALKNNIIDGQENPISTIWTQKFFEVARYITLTKHIYGPLLLSISIKTWELISSYDQEAIIQAAKESSVYSRKSLKQQENRMLRDIERAGSVISHPNIELWAAAMKKGLEKFKKEYGIDFQISI